MSKFSYQAEGELNSQYLLGLLNEYLDRLAEVNDTKGVVEDDFKINVKAGRFNKWFKDKTKRIGMNKALLNNYNKVIATANIKEIRDKIQIYLQTNVLEAKEIFDLKQTLKAIKFDIVMPEIDEGRDKAIKQSQKRFLKVLNDIKYLKSAYTEYILFNSPVADLKPFISDKVSVHFANPDAISEIVTQYIMLRKNELTNTDFEPIDVKFKANDEDFYTENITDNGIGEEVEQFIRSKMLEKYKIVNQEQELIEDKREECAKIDALLKKLKVNKIEQTLQKLVALKINLAHVEEVMANCKDIINDSTIDNKGRIFLLMDNLYYKLSKQYETLREKTKLKLQLVDKQKMFDTLDNIQNPVNISKRKNKSKAVEPDIDYKVTEEQSKIVTDTFENQPTIEEDKVEEENINSIISNLYDDDDDDTEIEIHEDVDGDHEEEFIIDETDDEPIDEGEEFTFDDIDEEN